MAYKPWRGNGIMFDRYCRKADAAWIAFHQGITDCDDMKYTKNFYSYLYAEAMKSDRSILEYLKQNLQRFTYHFDQIRLCERVYKKMQDLLNKFDAMQENKQL